MKYSNISYPNSGQQIEYDWLTLKFTGADSKLENSFQDSFFISNLNHIRHCHMYTILFYVAMGFIDYYLFDQDVAAFLTIRFGVVVPVFIAGFLFTFRPLYKKLWKQVSFFYILITGGSFIGFTIIGHAPEAYDYYVGIIFCLVFGYTFIREPFIYASAAGCLLIAIYFFSSVFITKMPQHTLIISLFYLALLNCLGMIISRYMELSSRKDFYLEHQLSSEREKVDTLNDELEQRVKDRTSRLNISNKMLRTKIDELETSEAEKGRLENKLRQAYKMEAIGTLAGGIAHDFNNILSGISGYSEILELNLDKPDKAKAYITRINQATRRAADLVKQILNFSRDANYEKRSLELKLVVKEAMKLLRSSIPSTISINEKIRSDSMIMADPAKMHQVIMNLCTNAYQAMSEKGGTLELDLCDVTVSDPESKSLKIKPGKYIKLKISDTGCGMDEKTQKKIFDPYFTTKEIGKGTGMGLSIVYAILREHQGHIQVDSHLGKGSVFKIHLPVTEHPSSELTAEVKPQVPAPLLEGHETIMVVDDEQSILESTRDILSDFGYQVLCYPDGDMALDAFEKTPDKFDLVITDLTMPGLTGDVLSERMLQIRPDVPVIMCSGYNEKMTPQKALDMGIKKFLFKPVVNQSIVEIVRNTLDSR